MAVKYMRARFRLLASISKTRAAEKAFKLFCTPQYRNKKKLPRVFHAGEKIEFRFQGQTVRGFRFNHPSENKILICHGFESSIINFDRYIQPLINRGYEVLAFDAPAHGRSSGKQINILMYRDLLHHIYEHYGPVKNFIGHSLGALALSLFLERIPHDETFRLVLIAPATSTTRAIDNFFSYLRLDAEVRKAFDELLKSFAGREAAWFSVERAAAHIRAGVLFLQDKNDELTPYEDVVPIIKQNYPNFRFEISEGLGHRRIYRDQQSYKKIIDFL